MCRIWSRNSAGDFDDKGCAGAPARRGGTSPPSRGWCAVSAALQPCPTIDFDVWIRSPLSAAHAAFSASMVSDLPRRRRSVRSRRQTSTTSIPASIRCRVSPVPITAGALHADQLDVAAGAHPPQKLPIAGRGWWQTIRSRSPRPAVSTTAVANAFSGVSFRAARQRLDIFQPNGQGRIRAPQLAHRVVAFHARRVRTAPRRASRHQERSPRAGGDLDR